VEGLVIRDSVPSDLDFIYNSWLTNYQATSFFAKKIKKHTFMKFHPVLLNALMNRPDVVVKIAGDDEFSIYGWLVAEKHNDEYIVHYCYIRPEFRLLGIAKELLASLAIQQEHIECTHWTPVMNEIQAKDDRFQYCPYKI
jgi:GNAT superfamily N-acetyltransferase